MEGFQRQISIVLKVKGAEEAQKAIDGVIPRNAPKRTKQYTESVDGASRAKSRLSRNSKKATTGVKDFTGKLFSSLAVISLFNRGLDAVVQNFERGASFERASVVFENTVGSIEKMLPQLRSATRGTVEDLKLIQTANRAVTEGLDPNKLKSVYQMATVASRKLGLSLTDTISTITKAVNRHDESAMTTLGIIMKNNEAYQVLQSQIGAMGGPINSALKIQARHNFVMTQLAGKYGEFNSLQADSLEMLEQVRTSMLNLTRQAGQLTIIAFKPLIAVFKTATDVAEHFVKALSESDGLKPVIQSFALIAASVATIATGLTAFKILKQLQFGAMFTLPGILMMIGAGLAVSAIGIERVQEGFEKAGLATKVFIDLMKNYDPNTGMTSALEKDAQQLGGLYNLVLGLARGFKVVEAIGKGVFQGVINALKNMGGMLGSLGGMFEEVFNAIANNEPVKQSTLDKIQDMVALFSESLTYLYPIYKLFIGVGMVASGILTTIKAIKYLITGQWVKSLASWATQKIASTSAFGNIVKSAGSMGQLGSTVGGAAARALPVIGGIASAITPTTIGGGDLSEEQMAERDAYNKQIKMSNSQQEVTDMETQTDNKTLKGILDGINKLVDNSDDGLRKQNQQAIREMVGGLATE